MKMIFDSVLMHNVLNDFDVYDVVTNIDNYDNFAFHI